MWTAEREYPRGPPRVILLAGLRASGKSLCGRALQKLLGCSYVDLDESGVIGPKKFKIFYDDCLKKIDAEGGLWIVDKLGPYRDAARNEFLVGIRGKAEASMLLQFVHSVELEELRICYSRFLRRGNNHRDVASSDEDAFMNVKSEQVFRRGLTDTEVVCLTHVKDVQIKATPYQMLFQTINHLHVESFIDKTDIGIPLQPFLEEALRLSLHAETEIGDKVIQLEDISNDNLPLICSMHAPFEPESPERPWMKFVRGHCDPFLRKCGVEDTDLFCDIVQGDTPVEKLFELFCSACEATRHLREHRSALHEWLKHDENIDRVSLYRELDINASHAFTSYCKTLRNPKALELLGVSLRDETEMGNKVIKPGDISDDVMPPRYTMHPPYEPESPERPWMKFVRDHYDSFLRKCGIKSTELFCEIVHEDQPVEKLFELFCSACEATHLFEHRSALREWLNHEENIDHVFLYRDLDKKASDAFSSYRKTLCNPNVLELLGVTYGTSDLQEPLPVGWMDVSAPSSGPIAFDEKERSF